MSKNATLEISRFLADLTYDDLTSEVIEKTKKHILDGLGNQVCGSQDIGSKLLVQTFENLNREGGSTVITYPFKMWAPIAALLNGTMAHSVEMDDSHRDSLTKAGSVLVPTVLAVSEHCNSTGKEMLIALVCGYETMIRIGLSINPGHRSRGFHSTGTIGAFGAAAVTAKLLRLNGWETANAFGIAGTQSSGLAAFLDHSSMIKGFNAGKGAFNGIISGLLAQKGFTGPINILEGKEGFCTAYSDDVKLNYVTEGFGKPLKIMEVGFKPHAACRYAHGPIDVVAEIITAPVSVELIKQVIVWTSPLAIRQSDIPEPKTLHAAQGSSNYSIALAIVTGKKYLNIEDFKNNWCRQDIVDLSKKIKLKSDEKAYGYMGRGCRVRLEFVDNRVVENSLELPKGEPENPLTDKELREKFKGLFIPIMGKNTGEKVIKLVRDIDMVDNIGPLMDILRNPDPIR